jgi:hypothetical protein
MIKVKRTMIELMLVRMMVTNGLQMEGNDDIVLYQRW